MGNVLKLSTWSWCLQGGATFRLNYFICSENQLFLNTLFQ